MVMSLANPCFSADQWDKDEPDGTTLISDLDAQLGINNEALDRMLIGYREGVQLKYNSSASITATSGQIACSNAGGTIARYRSNASSVDSVWTVGNNGLDTGSEAANTTYYVYAECDTDETGFKIKLSTNASTPSGVTYFARLGSFVNDSSSDITVIKNDNERLIISTGTVSNAATIPVPSGWSEDECDWTVAPNSVGPSGTTPSDAINQINTKISSGRTVNCTVHLESGSNVGGTCNYIIGCYR